MIKESNAKFLLEMFRAEYCGRLNEVIGEAEAFDSDGNMVLSQDLKVRHKDSGLEYTIDKVEGEDGSLEIHLRSPESPRFEPAPETKDILGEPRSEEVLGEQDDADVLPADELLPEPETEEVVFVIDQKEFEDEYEVD